MTQHFTIISKFIEKTKEKPLDFSIQEDKFEIMKMIMKASDICNITRPFSIAKKWAKNCIQEFFVQGDLEKSKKIPVGQLNDRNNLNFPKSQLGFVDYVALPLFNALVSQVPSLKFITDKIDDNKKFYNQLLLEKKENISEIN
jgi:hypothetical protein